MARLGLAVRLSALHPLGPKTSRPVSSDFARFRV